MVIVETLAMVLVMRLVIVFRRGQHATGSVAPPLVLPAPLVTKVALEGHLGQRFLLNRASSVLPARDDLDWSRSLAPILASRLERAGSVALAFGSFVTRTVLVYLVLVIRMTLVAGTLSRGAQLERVQVRCTTNQNRFRAFSLQTIIAYQQEASLYWQSLQLGAV
jgi:hypothetical protein